MTISYEKCSLFWSWELSNCVHAEVGTKDEFCSMKSFKSHAASQGVIFELGGSILGFRTQGYYIGDKN